MTEEKSRRKGTKKERKQKEWKPKIALEEVIIFNDTSNVLEKRV